MSNQQSVKARSSPTQTWIALGKTGRYQQLPSCTFFALHDLYPGSCPKVVILTQLPFAVEMWAQMGQLYNKHSLKEHLWHVASTTSTVASLRVARLRWLPRQAKLSLHVGWHRTRKLCQWPWNVKSTLRKARSSSKQTWIALAKTGRYLQLRSFALMHFRISI